MQVVGFLLLMDRPTLRVVGKTVDLGDVPLHVLNERDVKLLDANRVGLKLSSGRAHNLVVLFKR